MSEGTPADELRRRWERYRSRSPGIEDGWEARRDALARLRADVERRQRELEGRQNTFRRDTWLMLGVVAVCVTLVTASHMIDGLAIEFPAGLGTLLWGGLWACIMLICVAQVRALRRGALGLNRELAVALVSLVWLLWIVSLFSKR